MKRKLLLLAGAVAAALLLAEAGVRWLRPGFVAGDGGESNPFWSHDPELGWRHRPGQKGTFSRDEFTHPVSINSMGFRDREREPDAGGDGGPWRIAVFGDSFTWGHGVADEEIFTRILERSLPSVEIWNFGVSAYSTDQELLLLRTIGPFVHPDVVLVMISRNDFPGNMTEAYGAYHKPRFVGSGPDGGSLVPTGIPVPEPSFVITAGTWLRRRSAFANGLFELMAGGSLARREPSGGREAQVRLMEGLLDEIEQESGRLGARLAVALVPSVAHVHFERIHEPEAGNSAAVVRWGEERGVPVLDLTPPFRAEFATTGRHLFYHRDKHWTPDGHRFAAGLLASMLPASGLAPVPPGAGDSR